MHRSSRLSFNSTEKVEINAFPHDDVSPLSKALAGLSLDTPSADVVAAAPVAADEPETVVPHIFRIPPVEILSQIFCAGAEDDKYNFALLVSHVSGRFRDVALNTPKLWNYIDYQGGKSSYDEIAARLQRSRGAPLYITVNKVADLEQAQHMLDLLLPHLSRWRSLSVEIWEQDPAELVMTFLTDEAPMLQTLHLAGFTSVPVSPFGGQVPSLRNFTVRNMPLTWDTSLLESVQSLYIHSASFTNPSRFAEWQNIRKLTIRADPMQPLAFDYGSVPVCLPHLETLELNGVTEDDIIQILSFIEMPQLRQMLFTHIKDSPNHTPHILFPLPNMRELRLHATEMCQENLLRVLRQVRFLDQISFEDSSPIPTFIEALTPAEDQVDTWMCPNITGFKVIAFEKDNAHRMYDDTDIAKALVDMMRIRVRAQAEGKPIHVQMCVFEGERDDVTRHATEWGVERPYKAIRSLSL